jgi:sarcosine oxidase subunit gamma
VTADRGFRVPPLAGLADRMRQCSIPDACELREVAFLAQVNVRLTPGTAEARAVESALGARLPAEPNTAATGGGRDVLWLGPDEWLVVAPEGTGAETEAAVRQALGGRFGTAVDVSANRAVLELAGPAAREVLATCCGLDLHPRVFGPGQCAQTLLAKAQVVLQQVDDRPAYRLFVRPSFGAYVVAWLGEGIAAVARESAR